jgi:hypothetical protein
MMTERKQSILILAVVALIILNLSTLVTIFYQRHKELKENRRSGQAGMTMQGQENFSGRYFHERLNLSPEQMNEFRKFNPVFRKEAREINEKLVELRSMMLEEMARKESDINTLNAFSDSIGIYHSRLKKITFGYYLNLKDICSASQQQQLEELFSETFGNDIQKGYRNRFRNRGGMSGRSLTE